MQRATKVGRDNWAFSRFGAQVYEFIILYM